MEAVIKKPLNIYMKMMTYVVLQFEDQKMQTVVS